MIDSARTTNRSYWLFGFAVMVATLVYLPGLSGSFTYDDSGVLLNNPAIKVVNPDISDWIAAAASFGVSGVNSRWLGMLSFAVNHSLTGMDPYWFKLTNLVIHLVNGLLLFLALRALFDLHELARGARKSDPVIDGAKAAAVLAGIWLVLPINLTAVLYVSQRLESLSNSFVFLGLWWYLRARIASWEGRRGHVGLWLSLVLCTTIGLQIKESAVLLPLYAFCAEFALTGGRDREGRWSRPILVLYGALLVLPLVAGLVWIGDRMLHPRNFGRDFDTAQRLMTESRVMFDYMIWILTPSLDSLTLYHDDIALSKGLLSPPTTLAALLGIAGMLGVALWQRAKRPLLALGIFWFFGGHLLTGTIVPLLIAFEHRNYFPSVGLILAVASPLALEQPMLRTRVITVGAVCLFAFYAFTTALRSLEWSSPLQLAGSEASKRPESSASQYEYARILLNSSLNGDPKPMQEKAFAILERMAANPAAEATHNQLLIVYSTELGRPINPAWWDSMIAKLGSRPPTSTEVTALMALLKCYEDRFCAPDIEHLGKAFSAAASHASGYAKLHSAYADFALNYLHDTDLAEREFREAVRQAPNDPQSVAGLAEFLIQRGRIDEARAQVDRLADINRLGVLDNQIAKLKLELGAAEAHPETNR